MKDLEALANLKKGVKGCGVEFLSFKNSYILPLSRNAFANLMIFFSIRGLFFKITKRQLPSGIFKTESYIFV
jgi:hypothetical protein